MQALLPKIGMRWFLMFREISLLFTLFPGNKIHSWHAVYQGFSWDSVSGRPVTNIGPKGLFHKGFGYIPPEIMQN